MSLGIRNIIFFFFFLSFLGYHGPAGVFMSDYSNYYKEEDSYDDELSEEVLSFDNGRFVDTLAETKGLDGVWQKLKEEYCRFARLACLPHAAAVALLHHFLWNMQVAQEEYFLDPEKHLNALKIEICEKDGIVLSSSEECMICGEMSEDGYTFGLDACHHFFCLQCWKDEISFRIEKGEELFDLRCMGKCNQLVSIDSMVYLWEYTEKQAGSPSEGGKKILEYVATHYGIQSPCFSRCINGPECPGFAYLPIKHQAAPTVYCGFCGRDYCFTCRRPRHEPASCSEVQRWEDYIDHDSASVSCVLSTTKGCPRCKRRIEKNSGCLHMICRRPCFYEFCWKCLGPWEDHDNFTCNRPLNFALGDKAVENDVSEAFHALFREYDRNKAKQREEETYAQQQLRLRIIDPGPSDLANSSVDEMRSAAGTGLNKLIKTLHLARNTLMYSYVKQWVTTEDLEKRLLSHRTQSLENAVQKLSSLMLSDALAWQYIPKEIENSMHDVNCWINILLRDPTNG